MRRRRRLPRLIGIALLLVVVLVPVASGRVGGTEARGDGAFWSATAHELRLRGSVNVLAADGDRVAFDSCRWVGGVWQPGHDPHFFGGEPASDACTNLPPGTPWIFDAFAVAADRVAYLLRGGGIGVFGRVAVASAQDGYQPHDAASFGRCCSGDPVGDERWGELVGGGDTIAYATWAFHESAPVRVAAETVSRADSSCAVTAGAPCPQVASSTQALVPLAAALGQLLLRRADGALELRSPTGTLLRTLRVGTPLDAALAGKLLVVLAPGELRVFDTRTGSVLHRWPLRAVPLGGVCTQLPYQCPSPELELAGAANGLAAYVADGVVHVVRLADGLDAVIARGSRATITSAGLFYAYAGADPWPGRIRFVPHAQLFRAQAFPGSPAPPPRTSLFAQTTLQLLGPFPAGRAGSSIAAAGDVNGDGRPDVVVGAPNASPRERSGAGSAFVVFGRRKPGVVQLARPGANRFITIDGPRPHAGVRGAIAGLGDLSGDGLSDVAVPDDAGPRVAVILGSPRPRSIDLAAADPGVLSIDGLATANVAAAGDVNGDRLADILVCCTQTGAGAVIFGSRTFRDVDVDALGNRGFRITGAQLGPLAGVGDMNGDGLADVALAEIDTYKVDVVYGKRNTAAVDLTDLDGGGFRITGPYLGIDLAGVHDVNGDGLADLAVTTAAPESVAVVFGSRAAHPVDTDTLGVDGFAIENAGYPLGFAGDLNRDGLADISVRSSTGTSIVFGQRGGRPVDVGAAHFHGFTLAGTYGPARVVGDVNGDGQPDLLVASPEASNAGPSTGTLYLFSLDTRGPRVRARVITNRHRITVSAFCDEPCTVSASAGHDSTAHVYLSRPGRTARLRLNSSARVVLVRAVDDAGNVTALSRP